MPYSRQWVRKYFCEPIVVFRGLPEGIESKFYIRVDQLVAFRYLLSYRDLTEPHAQIKKNKFKELKRERDRLIETDSPSEVADSLNVTKEQNEG
jgi:hypothetical protein